MSERLLTTSDVADMLQVRPQTVRAAAWRGQIPCIRVWAGRKKSLLRFERGAILEFLRQRAVPAAEDR